MATTRMSHNTFLPSALTFPFPRHMICVPPGAHLLSDALISSPILSGDRSSSIPDELTVAGDGAIPSGSGTNNFEFGVDPSLDPELAMVRCPLAIRRN